MWVADLQSRVNPSSGVDCHFVFYIESQTGSAWLLALLVCFFVLFFFYRWQSRATLTTGLACWPLVGRRLLSWDPLSREGSPRVRFDNISFCFFFNIFNVVLDGAGEGYWCMFPASCLYGKFICLHPSHGQGHEWTSRQIHVDIKVIFFLQPSI